MTPKMKKFCDLYLTRAMGNGTQAAIMAGYSKHTANEIAAQNLTKISIQEYLTKRRAELEEVFMHDYFDVMNKHKILSDFNIQDCYDENGNLKNISDLPRDVAYGLTGSETILKKDGEEYDTITKIKSEPKSKVLSEMAKIKKLYEEYTPQEVVINVNIIKDE